jgi:putative (di)nucleoside polyphosphate hydrolase
MLLNPCNEVFVGRRIDTRSEAWQMPQGGIDEHESPTVAAMRELYEETGIRSARIVAESNEWFYYDLPDYLIPKLWNGKYRGQKQKWFALRFFGEDTEINIHQKNAEFMSWRWAGIEDLYDIIVPFKRYLYTAIIAEFQHVIF